VGRSNKKAFCYLLAPPRASLSQEAQKRLRAIEEFSELGSGINISMRDLDIRGAGNLLGGEQSGFINEIGFETYHKILDEAIRELKETEFSGVFMAAADKAFVSECVIETDMEILLPSEYIESGNERIKLYSELDNINLEDDLMQFTNKLIDRFGPLPRQSIDLINSIRLRWQARDLGIEKLILKNNGLSVYFLSNQDSDFYNSEIFTGIIRYVQQNARSCRMKETNQKLMLIIYNIKTVNAALNVLTNIKDFENF
jgi:transcription-repair coupling factor (superfamily II helicase)